MSKKEPVMPVPSSIRLIASDLDGTLLASHGVVSTRTHTTLQRIQESGITIVLVSGRPPRMMRTFAQRCGVTGLAICCNGALVYDLDQEKITHHFPLAPELALHLVKTLRAAIPDLAFACEQGLQHTREPQFIWPSRLSLESSSAIADATSFCDVPITKLLALHPQFTPEELYHLSLPIIGDHALATHSGSPFLEISAANIHKAHALELLCTQRGIQANEVIAFGDMPNDLPMLRWAGYSIAVANAHPLVLAEVSATTASNNEDGVALALEQLFFKDS